MTGDLFIALLISGFFGTLLLWGLGNFISFLIQRAWAFVNDSEAGENWFEAKLMGIIPEGWGLAIFIMGILTPATIKVMSLVPWLTTIVFSSIGGIIALLFIARCVVRLKKRLVTHENNFKLHKQEGE